MLVKWMCEIAVLDLNTLNTQKVGTVVHVSCWRVLLQSDENFKSGAYKVSNRDVLIQKPTVCLQCVVI